MNSLLFSIIFCYLIVWSKFSWAVEVTANSIVSLSQLSHREVVDIFTRKQIFWSNGRKIKVFVKPLDSVEHKAFTMGVLNMSSFKYQALLDSTSYSGINSTVTEVLNDSEMLYKLSSTPYSIGYINHTVIFNDNITLIRIDYD
jgi:ABC-type phosphate transport system substrate-binding protein